MTPEQQENLDSISEEIGSVMYHIDKALPDVGLAITELRELNWNNMEVPWRNSLLFDLIQAKRNLMIVSKELESVKLDETNCD